MDEVEAVLAGNRLGEERLADAGRAIWPPNGLSGVQIGPGATPFTRMPFSIRFFDKERVKAVIAPLVEL